MRTGGTRGSLGAGRAGRALGADPAAAVAAQVLPSPAPATASLPSAQVPPRRLTWAVSRMSCTEEPTRRVRRPLGVTHCPSVFWLTGSVLLASLVLARPSLWPASVLAPGSQ